LMHSFMPEQRFCCLKQLAVILYWHFRSITLYLNEKQVIDETLRFVNISFVSFRRATRDVFINGVCRTL
jgi:hypothetical protein